MAGALGRLVWFNTRFDSKTQKLLQTAKYNLRALITQPWSLYHTASSCSSNIVFLSQQVIKRTCGICTRRRLHLYFARTTCPLAVAAKHGKHCLHLRSILSEHLVGTVPLR